MVDGESDGDEPEDVCGAGTYVDMGVSKSAHCFLRQCSWFEPVRLFSYQGGRVEIVKF
jgi:hypothetical protein